MNESRDGSASEQDRRLARNLRALHGFSFFTYPLAAVPLLWFFYQERGLGLGDYGALVAVGYATMVAFELPTGWLADRVGRKTPMILGPLLFGSGWFVTWGSDPVAVDATASILLSGYALGQVLMSLGHALISGPPSALLFEHLQEHGRRESYLREESSQWRRVILGSSIAFLLGGIVGQSVSLGAVVLLTGGLCICAIPFAFAVDESRRDAARLEADGVADGDDTDAPVWTRVWLTLRNPEVVWLGFLYVLLFFLLRYSFHTWQPWLEGTQHDDAFFIGALYASFSFFSLPFVRRTSRLNARFGDEATLLLCCALCAAALVGLSFGPAIWLIPLLYLQQIPFALHRPLAHAYANHRISSRDRALVLSMLSFVGRLGFSVTIALVLDNESVIQDDYFTVGLACLGLTTVLAIVRPRRTRVA